MECIILFIILNFYVPNTAVEKYGIRIEGKDKIVRTDNPFNVAV